MGEWDAWIGRDEHRAERIDESLVRRWLATFDRAAPGDGTVPQGLHWCLCTPEAPSARLGEDGHPRRDDSPASFLPPVPLPRRMWAASTIAFHTPLHPDEPVRRCSRVQAIATKAGGSGELVFVEVAHETHGSAGLAVNEVQTIVYRAAAAPDAPLSPPPAGAGAFDSGAWPVWRRVEPGEPLLLRYSALTFNAHRIHYDRPYAEAVERYRGLVVHGPLTATLLLDLAARELGDNRLTRFSFRGQSPAIAGEGLNLAMRPAGSGWELAAIADDGRAVMSASAA